jgi:fibronectin type 3 domain-containing protein
VAKVKLKVKGAEISTATVGDRILIDLPLPDPLPAQPELHYYAVKMFGPHNDASDFSNQGILQPRPAPAPPASTHITAGIVGYNIYRRDSQSKGFGPAIHAALATDRTYLDTTARFGQSYIYVVTAVAQRNPVIESSIKTETEVKYVDRFPPPVPTEAVALVEPGRVRLVWRGSEAPDLAGYRISRLDTREAKGEYKLLTETPIHDVQFTDSNVAAGATYAYRITAIDQSGNESEPAEVRATAQ